MSKHFISYSLLAFFVGAAHTHANEGAVASPKEGSADMISEGFENGGWNAPHSRGFTPGLNKGIPEGFMFNQLQGNHSFELEDKIVREGNYSAKLVWYHKHPAKFNGDERKVDNVDRKAMFHGFKTKKYWVPKHGMVLAFSFPLMEPQMSLIIGCFFKYMVVRIND